MKIAVTYENGNVYPHFGHTEEFKIFNIENNKIISSEIVSTNGEGHSQLGAFLKRNDVEVLICGGIGAGAKAILSEVNIKLLPGVSGSADKAVQDFLDNKLVYNTEVECEHHHHHHKDEDKCNHEHGHGHEGKCHHGHNHKGKC